MLDVPEWFWLLCDRGVQASKGWMTPKSSRQAMMLRRLEHEQAQAENSRRQRAETQSQLRSLTNAALVGR